MGISVGRGPLGVATVQSIETFRNAHAGRSQVETRMTPDRVVVPNADATVVVLV
jgi:hypothetical protein